MSNQCIYKDNNEIRCENKTGKEYCRFHCRKYNKCIYLKKNGTICNANCRKDYCKNHSINTRLIKKSYRKRKYEKDKGLYKWVKIPIIKDNEK